MMHKRSLPQLHLVGFLEHHHQQQQHPHGATSHQPIANPRAHQPTNPPPPTSTFPPVQALWGTIANSLAQAPAFGHC